MRGWMPTARAMRSSSGNCADATGSGPARGGRRAPPWPACRTEASAMTENMTGLADARHARRVAECLLACGAFTVDLRMPRERWFRWKSGIVAPFGCDCRRVNAFPAARRLIDGALADAVGQAFPDAGYVVGIAQAGIGWAKTLADRLGLPLAYVRAQPRAA